MDINTAIHEAMLLEGHEMEMECVLEYETTEERDSVYEAVKAADDFSVEKYDDVYDADEYGTRCIIITLFSNMNTGTVSDDIEEYCEKVSGIPCDEIDVEETGYSI